MLASNRNVEKLVKQVPERIRGIFIEAQTLGASENDIAKMLETFQTALDDYRTTLIEDGEFYSECALHPYNPTKDKYTYSHLLETLRLRLEQASTLEERELLRRTHYHKLSEYKFMSSIALEPLTDKLLMGLETPNAFIAYMEKLFKRKQQPPQKQPAVEHIPKSAATAEAAIVE